MCSIFGLGLLKNHKVNRDYLISGILYELFREAESRGHDASGIATINSNNVAVFKNNVSGSKIVHSKEYKKVLKEFAQVEKGKEDKKVTAILGHCRAKTKGTEKNNKNNHPIIRNKVIGVHNGVITNDDALFKKYNEHFKRDGSVDSEIIFALIDHYTKEIPITDAIIKVTDEIFGSFACAMTHVSQPHLIWLFKNYNPCDILFYPEVGMIVWASNKRFITKACARFAFKLGNFEEIKLENECGMCIDLYRNMFNMFNLTGNKRYITKNA